GSTPPRAIFTAVVLGLGLVVFIRRFRKDPKIPIVLGLMLIGFGFAMASLRVRGSPLASRYMMALMPLYFTILATGILHTGELLGFTDKRRLRFRSVPSLIFLVVATLLWIFPAFLSNQLLGRPTPYKLINAWVDRNLPSGTLVL